jgi:hypothetical protein
LFIFVSFHNVSMNVTPVRRDAISKNYKDI